MAVWAAVGAILVMGIKAVYDLSNPPPGVDDEQPPDFPPPGNESTYYGPEQINHPTYGTVANYQTIKQRYILKKITLTEGYEARFPYDLAFFSGMAIWCPVYTTIMKAATVKGWNMYPQARWRWLILESQIEEQSIIDEFLRIVGLTPFSNYINYIAESLRRKTKFWYPVWPNLGFKHTVNDVVLRNNWDYIVSMLGGTPTYGLFVDENDDGSSRAGMPIGGVEF